MITKTDLGIHEQLCSQMSQYAMLYFLARHNNQELVFVKKYFTKGRGVKLYDLFPMPNRIIGHREWQTHKLLPWVPSFQKLLPKNGDNIDQRLLELSKSSNYDINGHFGLYRDWQTHLEQILDIFTFKPYILNKAITEISQIRSSLESIKKLVSIHIRRTDYIGSSSHVNLTESYFSAGMEEFSNSECSYVVFSDDIEWCRQQSFLRDKSAIFSNSSNYVELAMMSLCDHHIISNSSFSFWGALLNRKPTSKVICPYFFVKDSCESFKYLNGNYYPQTWIALDNI